MRKAHRRSPTAVAAATLLTCLACSGPDAEGGAPSAGIEFGEIALDLGALDAPPSLVFGRIADLAALPGGRLLVLDRQAMEVRLFDEEGRMLAAAGGPGEGPGEFRGPSAFIVVDDSTLLVLDRGLRLSQFRIADSALAYVGEMSLDLFPSGMCAVNGRVFVEGLHEGHGVHEIDLDGDIVRSFHPIPDDLGFDLGPEWESILEAEATTGYLACLDEPATVAMVSEWLPDIYAYSLDGQRLWKTTIPGYRIIEPVLMPDGGQTWERAEEGSHAIVSLEAHPGGYFLVQTLVLPPMGAPSEQRPSTYLLDAASGAISPIETSGATLRDVSRTLALGFETDPFPRVVGQVVTPKG